MTARRSDRRPVKIRRRGRHAAPSQVDKVAAQAGRAAPAVAIAGALVTAPQALAGSAQATTVTVHARQTHQTRQLQRARAHATTEATAARLSRAAVRYYKVSSGDTLSVIAERFYHKAADWRYLYQANEKTIPDPNLIYVGQTLLIPASLPAHGTPASYAPRHARPARHGVKPAADRHSGASGTAGTGNATSSAGGGTVVVQSASQHAAGLSGTLNCSGLERLWDAAGGNPAAAFTAAEIAMAESGGNQYALSPTRDYGYWQINAANGPLATFDAYGNARSAIIISHDGTNWSPWTTYTSGAYAGRC